MVDRQTVVDIVRAEVPTQIDDKLRNGEAIYAYVEKIAKEVSSKAIDARLTPFYRHPTFLNILAVVVGVLAIFGVSVIWGEIIRTPLQTFLKIDEKIGQVVQRKQYEAYIGAFEFGSFANLSVEENERCNRTRRRYLSENDVLIPRSEVAQFVPSCINLTSTLITAEDIPFIAEEDEDVEIEILLVPRRTPTIEDGFEEGKLSLTKLNAAVTTGGNLLGRDVDPTILVEARIDQQLIELKAADSMIPITSPDSSKIYDSLRLWGRHKIDEKAGHFHNLAIALIAPDGTSGHDKNFVVRIFIERNRLAQEPSP